MQRIILPGSDLAITRFIFGCAGLFTVGGGNARRRLLDAAADSGFGHFDTAPLYSFGQAEWDLKPVLRRHPDIGVTTKVGLYPPGGTRQSRVGTFARKAGGRLWPRLSRPIVDLSLGRARASLDGSLRRLGRTRIELFMVHEPDTGLLDTDEWQRWLEDERAVGRVAHFGIALEASRLPPILSANSSLSAIVQTTDSLHGCEADVLPAHGRALQITYGYVSAARRIDRRADVEAILRGALHRNRKGAIVVSTGRIERLAQYRRLASETP